MYGDVRVLRDGVQLLGVPLGPAAAARADRRATTARCRNGAIPERANRAFGSLCRIALLAPVNAGAAESDAMVRTWGRRRRPRLFFSRGSAAQRPCLPLPRAGLVHVRDSNLRSKASGAPNNSIFESPEWAGKNSALSICPYEFEVRGDRLFLNAPPSDSWGKSPRGTLPLIVKSTWKKSEFFPVTYGPRVRDLPRPRPSESTGDPPTPADTFCASSGDRRGTRRDARHGTAQTANMSDNASKLQAMQDAVTDAGNDVRALKVRAGSRDAEALYRNRVPP